MPSSRFTRRRFLKRSAPLLAGSALVPGVFAADGGQPGEPRSKNDRFRIGAVGMRYQGSVIAEKALAHGDVVAICDVDRQIAEKAKQHFGGKADLYEDYREMLDRQDIDVVTIGTPDHWHTAMVVDACRAGKDIYVEKPLTLTVDEGKTMRQVVTRTGRVLQVGSWQRSDCRFRLACEMVRDGCIGKLQKVTVVLGKNKTGGPFQVEDPPPHLNWDRWQGQTPAVPYIEERCHYTFRWWYEYSGGQMTDWGAHHLDIAQWGMGMDGDGPVEVQGKARFPDVPNGYNVAIDFWVRYRYPNGVEMEVLDNGRNGVMFEGTEGRIFVNRGTVSGKPVEDLAASVNTSVDQVAFHPDVRERFGRVYDRDNHARPPRAGKLDAIINHMGNFFDCVKDRQKPISDVESQHRSVTVCHLGNISMHLGRKLVWDPELELFVGDDEANSLLARPQRSPYQTQV
jgi:predicted dehydrogenase